MTTKTPQPGIGTLIAVDDKGRQLWTYVKEKRLGEGGGAVVYLAQKLKPDTVDGDPEDADDSYPHVRRVAVKEAFNSLTWRGRLAKEAKILRQLSRTLGNAQRRVVRSDGEIRETHGAEESKTFIELEYLDGVTLDEWFHKEWFPPALRPWEERVEKAAEFALHLAQALQELETVDVIHRDIKPTNIMVTTEGLRLFDFNIAKEANSDQTHTKFIGTPGFQAPEVKLGQSYDRRADMFNVGVVVWAVLHQGLLDVDAELDYGRAEYVIDWPSRECAGLPDHVAGRLHQLVTGLLCDQGHRMDSPARVVELAEELLDCLKPQLPDLDEVLQNLDLIQLIFELRASGQASVVADMDETDPLEEYVRTKTRVTDPLEEYLVSRIRGALNKESDAPKLLMLSGNAGDGKSYLIDRLIRHHLAGEPNLHERVSYIADATHALTPSESQQDRLEEFFAPFSAGSKGGPDKDLYLIAMNTGMVIRFFERAQQRWEQGEDGARDLTALYDTLQLQLGLKRHAAKESEHSVEVVNLDLRSLVGLRGDDSSFVHRMLEKLDIDAEEGFLSARYERCGDCPANKYCPVRFNLEAMAMDDVRAAIVRFLRRASIEPEVHLSPRNVWDFLYRLITGGMERYEAGRSQGESPCDLIRKKVATGPDEYPWLLRGQFTEQFFQSADRGPIWAALSKLDPAYTTVPKIDQLQTRLSVSGNLDSDPDTIKRLGGLDKVLAGLSLGPLLDQLPENFSSAERQNAAVRRYVLFDGDVANDDGTSTKMLAHFFEFGGFNRFDDLLDAYATYSRNEAPSTEQQNSLIELKELIKEAIVRSYGRQINDRYMLRVSQPNARSSSHLLVEAKNLDEEFRVDNLVQKDIHIQAHIGDGRAQLLRHLGYRPHIVTLEVAGNRLMVDESVFDFLQRVKAGQQPSAFDLAQFQALRYIAERLGNQLARTANRLFVIEGKSGDLYKLSQNEFGAYSMTPEEYS